MNGFTTENILQPFQSKGMCYAESSPARGEGNEMCQYILKANGKVVPRRSVKPLQKAEIHSPSELKKRQVFDELIERRHGTSINPPKPKVQQLESAKVEFEYSE
jgi:hypothetical protein